VIGYGVIQSLAPALTGSSGGLTPDGRVAVAWALPLAVVPAAIALIMSVSGGAPAVLLWGLMAFGALFAVNSSLHSYLIISYAQADGVSLDVGFYYMSNAAGRLIGTLLSGWVFQVYGLEACLYVSSAFLALAAAISLGLPVVGTPSRGR
jgi:predicted MFS family arabinose efflux permease